MADAGIELVRVGEFAWSRFEPEPGRLDFAWLDEAIAELAANGIGVVMGTPTATPPRWLCDAAESAGEPIYQVDYEGRSRAFGTRRHYCHNNPRYIRETKRIVTEQVAHFAANEAIVAWQIDNEFGCHDTTVCYCEHCRSAFVRWLRNRFVSVDALNEAWGTVFWSQEYRDFDDVIVPAYTAVEQPGRYTHNPGLLLDYQRFCSDSVVAYQQLQVDHIHAQSRAPITHNFMGHFADVDYYDLARELDFVSWDNYPMNQWGDSNPSSIAMAHDITRGAKRRNFWVMEQLSGPCGWAVLGPTPAPGQIRLWSYQGVAHGADAIVYFRWRAALFGTEQYWYGVLDHDGVPRRRYREISAVGGELATLSDVLDGTSCSADVLLLRSFDNLWSQRFQPQAEGLSYEAQLQAHYDALAAYGAQIDVSELSDDLSGYRLIVAPLLSLTDERTEEALAGYVKDGGTLVLTFRSGTRHMDNTMRRRTIPGPLAELAGVTVDEFDALGGRRSVRVNGGPTDAPPGAGLEGTASVWLDVVDPADGTEVVARYADGHYDGRAAVTRRRSGEGSVVYVGCDLDSPALTRLMTVVAAEAGVASLRSKYVTEAPACIELALRSRDDAPAGALFVLNHGAAPATVTLTAEACDQLTGRTVRRFALEPYGVAVMEVSP
jgi:beta-galactosidase